MSSSKCSRMFQPFTASFVPGGRRAWNVSIGLRRVPTLAAGLAALFLFYAGLSCGKVCAENVDFGPYRAAVEYCRGGVARPMALSVDRRVLCLDGLVTAKQDLSVVNSIEPGGLFVVRNYGGDDLALMKLANILRDHGAVVVVNDYCLMGCASYLLLASSEAVVPKDALVAWRPLASDPGDCLGFARALDGGPPRFDVGSCADPFPFRTVGPIYKLRQKFIEARRVSPEFEEPPQSTMIRKKLIKLDRDELNTVMWTWHPRYQPSSVTTKIVYEAYPESQEEVTALAERLQLRYRVIYDP